LLPQFSLILPNPSHVAPQLANHAIISAGNLKFNNDKIALRVNGWYVNEPAAGRKLNVGDSFILVEL
jgi:hypothetical protein